MTTIRTINSEVEIRDDMTKSFKRHRVLEQNAFYLSDGAKNYYNPNKKFSKSKYNLDGIYSMLKKTLKNKNNKTAIISLGCGSCEKEKEILTRLNKENYNFSFYGVDSSMSMINLADKALNSAKFPSNLICADFGSLKFRLELDKIIGKYDVKIFLFFGHTLGNLNQSYMADILKNLMNKGDYLLIDIIGFKEINSEKEAKLFERYVSYLNSEPEIEFFLYPLKNLGVDTSCGEVTLEMRKNTTINALLFQFGFKVLKQFEFFLDGDEVILIPDEYIELYNILIYDLNKLTAFFERRNFKLKEMNTGQFLNQILFEKI